MEFVGGDVAVEHEFPVAHADRAAVGHGVDEDVFVRRGFAFGDHGPDVAAIERMRLMERSAGEIHERGEPVHHVQRLVDHGAGLDPAGPVCQGTNACAALVKRALLRSEPAVGATADTEQAAVVAGEKDERVADEPAFLQRGYDALDLLIEALNHRGIDLALLVGEVRVAFQILGRCLQRCVRGVEGQVKEEGLLVVLLLDHAHGLIAQQGGRVALVVAFLVVAMPVVATIAGVSEEVDRAIVVAVLSIESALHRQVGTLKMAEMPLPADVCGVTGFLQRLRQRALVQRQAVLRPRADHADLQAMPDRIPPRHQGRASGRADGQHIKLLQLRPALRELVEMRRLDFITMPTHIRPAKVIGEDVDDVGLVRGQGGAERQQKDGEELFHGEDWQQNEDSRMSEVLDSGTILLPIESL